MVQPYFENLKMMDSEVRSFSLNPPNAPPFASIFPGFVAARNLSFYELGHFGAGSVAIIKKDYRISFLAPNCSPPKKMPLRLGEVYHQLRRREHELDGCLHFQCQSG